LRLLQPSQSVALFVLRLGANHGSTHPPRGPPPLEHHRMRQSNPVYSSYNSARIIPYTHGTSS
jgi:hypothetical protein